MFDVSLWPALRTSQRRPNRQSGVTTVEFALVLPFVLAVLFGSIDGGRLVIARCMVSYAAVVSARVASVRSTTQMATVKTAATNAVPYLTLNQSLIKVYVNAAEVTTDTAFAAKSAGAGNTVSVSVAYAYTPLTPLITKLAAKTLTATSKVVTE